MERITGMVTGPLHIVRDTELKGIIKGPVTVDAGCHLLVTGIVKGTITLTGDATIDLPGIFNGEIVRG